MIGANQYDLTWSHFEQLHADKKIAFENLCRSLFKRALCQEGNILHSDPNHPGVEVEPVLAQNGKTRISFQAKHFDNKIGYAQIEKSAKEAALYYEGELDVIYLYCNKDITATSTSFREIEKILNYAGIKITLVTGQAILDQAMDYPPVLSCYFGLDSLDDAWFQRNLKLSLDNLGKRYNSLFNVDTEAQRNISLFLREEEGLKELNAKKAELIEELKDLRWHCEGKYKTEITALTEWAKALPDVNLKTFSVALEWRDIFEKECRTCFDKLKNRLAVIQEELAKYAYNDSEYKNIRNEEVVVERILSVPICLDFSENEKNVIRTNIAIVTGEMGTGKSQLLATSAKRLMYKKRPVLLLLGQTFISDENIEIQIMQNLEGVTAGQSFESLVSVMEEKGERIGEEAVIFIDAINESRNRDIWKNGINRIIATVEQYRHVKLVFSLRSGFENLTLSQSVLDRIDSGDFALINHTGFEDESPERIYEFLSNCGIPFSPDYYLHSEMTNPLFLTWFCQTYTGEEQGLITLIDRVLKQADNEASKGVGQTEPVGILRPLIYEMIDASALGPVTKQVLLTLPAWNTYGVNNKTGYLNAIERAGVLTSYVREQEETYYIGYNLLEDYVNASRIIDREQSKEKIKEYCRKTLLRIDAEGNVENFGNESVFAMVASLYAIKYGEELIEVIDEVNEGWNRRRLIGEYFSSFIWRSSHITYDKFFELINKYQVEPRKVWNIFIENSIKEKSELNALGLTKLLSRYSLNRRDYVWTTQINELNEYDRIVSIAYYIEAGNALGGLSEDKAYLLLVTFAWMLSSSNRDLRDRISKAMIEILNIHFSVSKRLLEQFKAVNDPYIIQRLYGVVFGAVMRRKSEDRENFKELAQWVYTEIFDRELVYPDILLRDYARLIVERFAVEYPNDLEGIIIERIKPPYKSEPIPIVEEVDYGADEYSDSDLWHLLHSMKFDLKVKGIGMYGDFGRYVFQSALGYFIGLDVANVYYYALQFIFHDLGYDPKYFAEYDVRRNGYDRHHVKRIERIGKKYQWIAMYNILARVSDTYKLKGRNWNDKTGTEYEGPWKPYVRDFDPTLNVKIKTSEGIPQISIPKYGEEGFADINASEEEIEAWVLEEDKMFQDFPQRLVHKDATGKEWVSLYLHQENKLCPKEKKESVYGFPRGEQHVWTIATMYISSETKIVRKEQDLIESKFITRNCSDIRNCYSLFSREYAWSSGYKAEFKNQAEDDGESGINAFPAVISFLWEEEYDASQEKTTSFVVPAGQIIQEMQLYEKETDGVYYCGEEVVAVDLSIWDSEHTELVIRRDVLNKYIEKTNAQLFWAVVGEKQYFQGNMNQNWQRREGYFMYKKNKIVGSMRIVDNI